MEPKIISATKIVPAKGAPYAAETPAAAPQATSKRNLEVAILINRPNNEATSEEIITIAPSRPMDRSEEHTSELQSRGQLICRLQLEKKNTDTTSHKPQKY